MALPQIIPTLAYHQPLIAPIIQIHVLLLDTILIQGLLGTIPIPERHRTLTHELLITQIRVLQLHIIQTHERLLIIQIHERLLIIQTHVRQLLIILILAGLLLTVSTHINRSVVVLMQAIQPRFRKLVLNSATDFPLERTLIRKVLFYACCSFLT